MDAQLKRGVLDVCVLTAIKNEDSYGYKIIKDLKPTQVGTRREQGASFFASMLKCAGPLMQKLFQGIPEKMLMKQFRPALSIVKSDLRDIPPEYVDKQLLELKKNIE